MGASASGHQQVQASRLQEVLPGLCGRAQRSSAWGGSGGLPRGCSGPASPAHSARWPRGGASRSLNGPRARSDRGTWLPSGTHVSLHPNPPHLRAPHRAAPSPGAFPQAVCTRPHPACGSQMRQPKPTDCGSQESTPDIWTQGLDGEVPVLVFPSGQTDQHMHG